MVHCMMLEWYIALLVHLSRRGEIAFLLHLVVGRLSYGLWVKLIIANSKQHASRIVQVMTSLWPSDIVHVKIRDKNVHYVAQLQLRITIHIILINHI